jgi:hypothetical protein
MDGIRIFIAGVLLGVFSILGVFFLWVLYDQGVFSRSLPRYQAGYQGDSQESVARGRETYAASDQPPPPRIRRRPLPPPCDMSCF